MKNFQKNGQGVLRLTNGNVYVGTWDKDQKNGLLTLFKPKEGIKQREQYHMGTLKDSIRTPCAQAEMETQIKNPGYGKSAK